MHVTPYMVLVFVFIYISHIYIYIYIYIYINTSGLYVYFSNEFFKELFHIYNVWFINNV